MRILLISATYTPDPGGVATHLADLAHGLVHRKHEVDVVTLNKDDTERRDGYGRLTIWKRPRRQVYEFDGRRVLCESILRFVFDYWHEIKPDLVHVHDLDSFFLGCMTKIAFGKALVMTVHRAPSPWRADRFREVPKDCFMEAGKLSQMLDGIVVPSEASRTVLREQGFGANGNGPEIKVIPHGISPFLKSVADEPALLEELQLREGCSIILCPSRADEHKDVETFIEAAAQVKFAESDRDIVFLLSSHGDDPRHEKLRSRAREIGLMEGQDIIFRNFLYKEMATIYRLANVCVVPSRHESFGLTVLESFLFNVPVVAANTSALREIIANRKNGLLFTDGDPSDLASQIRRVLRDSELREILREGGRVSLQETGSYSSTAMVQAYEHFYGRILTA